MDPRITQLTDIAQGKIKRKLYTCENVESAQEPRFDETCFDGQRAGHKVAFARSKVCCTPAESVIF
jgi:hypothetical protein